jgi:HK97 family phage major capsid protein
MTVKELIEKRAKAWEAAKDFVNTHEDKNGNLSAEDAETYRRMEAEIEELTNSIDRQAMPTAMRTNFRQVANVLQEGVDADGGYLVPVEYDNRLIDVLTEENIMSGLATKITTSEEYKINIAATKPVAAWIEEGGALSFGDAIFDQIYLDAFKLHVAIKVTEELLYDSDFNLENYIITEFGKALSNAEEDAFLNGDGKGKPVGIFDKTVGGQSVGTLSATLKSDELLDLVYGLKRPYRKNASFIMNDATLAQIRKLKDNNGAYIWQPSY